MLAGRRLDAFQEINMLPETFRCFLVKKTGKEQIEAAVESRPLMELPAGEVLVQVAYSST